MALDCPGCGTIHLDGTRTCGCGHDFSKKIGCERAVWVQRKHWLFWLFAFVGFVVGQTTMGIEKAIGGAMAGAGAAFAVRALRAAVERWRLRQAHPRLSSVPAKPDAEPRIYEPLSPGARGRALLPISVKRCRF